MKNFTLLFAAILSLSMAYAQQPQSQVFDGKQPTTAIHSKVSLPGHLTVPNIPTPMNLLSAGGNHNTGECFAAQPRSVIALYDSAYQWILDTTTMAWDVSSKTIYVYDVNYKLLSQVAQNWSGNAWVNYDKDTFTYNSNNLDTSILVQLWSGSAWVNDLLYTYTYNTNNIETSWLYQEWSGSAWVNFDKDTFTYNSNNLITNELGQGWSGGAWVNNGLDTYTYNTNNLETSWLIQYWSGSAWDNELLYTYTYNSSNLEISWLIQYWSGSVWVNDAKYTYTYNSNNLWTSELGQDWSGNAWVKQEIDTVTYDANNIVLSQSLKVFSITGDQVISGDSTHWYIGKEINSGINEPSDISTIQLYPNPSGNFIHAGIRLKQTSDLQLRLVNMLGQTVWSTDAGNVSDYQNNISVANLLGGVYLLEMITDNGTESREVLVQK